jgi:hypothetical protein
MNTKEAKRNFIESLRTRLSPGEFGNLLRCLDPQLGYATESLKYRLSQITPERLARWEKERAEFQERIREQDAEGSWCDPFITRLPPPRNPRLDVDDVTDLLKYVYATLSRAISELQYQLAELAGAGRLDLDANEDLQWNWCFPQWEFLYCNTINAVRNENNFDDLECDAGDNVYASGRQVMTRVCIEPHETNENHWQFNKYLCGDGPIQEYPRGAIFHIAEPRFRERRE